jgi:hypothetical protein
MKLLDFTVYREVAQYMWNKGELNIADHRHHHHAHHHHHHHHHFVVFDQDYYQHHVIIFNNMNVTRLCIKTIVTVTVTTII